MGIIGKRSIFQEIFSAENKHITRNRLSSGKLNPCSRFLPIALLRTHHTRQEWFSDVTEQRRRPFGRVESFFAFFFFISRMDFDDYVPNSTVSSEWKRYSIRAGSIYLADFRSNDLFVPGFIYPAPTRPDPGVW